MRAISTLHHPLLVVALGALAGCLYPPRPVYDPDVTEVDVADDTMAPHDHSALPDTVGVDVAQTDATSADVPAVDTGTDAGPAIYNNCTRGDYVDRSASTADRRVYFAGAGTSTQYTFDPACITIAAGQSVTFSGDFLNHPLWPGISQTDTTAGSPNNPIPHTADGNTLTVRFSTPGVYPYFCETHVEAGMAGVVWVR